MSAAELSSAKNRHPWDWYVEQRWVTKALIDALGIEAFQALDFRHENNHVTWNPACGGCNIVHEFQDHGLSAVGTDIARRVDEGAGCYSEHDFLDDQLFHFAGIKHLSIVSNFPYSQQDGKLVRGLAEDFCRRSLEIATHKVCALLPIKWLAGERRQRFLTEFPPRYYLILNERPSMPPGNLIEQLGDKAFKRGKVDYMWVVWDKQVTTMPGETRTIHIAPRPKVGRG